MSEYCHTKAFGDGPCNSESWSRDEDDTRVGIPSSNFHSTPTGGRLSFNGFNEQICYGRPETETVKYDHIYLYLYAASSVRELVISKLLAMGNWLALDVHLLDILPLIAV
ncbi:hypothetical protein TNCV_3045141 [Trichonephila clavipes]|nr:hypothetical protein TNCV_3045141 [Trichonephila clavipes]